MNFVDTGIFLAIQDQSDQYHRSARQLWPKVQRLVTSNLVIAEFSTALARMMGYSFAAEATEEIYVSPRIEVWESTREDELEALRWMRKYADQQVSFTDCVSFALMRRHKIRTAFTFDRHFKLAGFNVIGLK